MTTLTKIIMLLDNLGFFQNTMVFASCTLNLISVIKGYLINFWGPMGRERFW